MSVYKRLRASAKSGDRRAALLLTLDNGRDTVAPQLQEYGLRLSKWTASAPGRALFSATDGSGHHLAVVLKDLVMASDRQAEQLRRYAPGEAEAWAARAERELLAAGAPCSAVSSAVCFATGHLDWVICAFQPEAGGSHALSLSANKREAARLDRAFCTQASPFCFASLSPSPLPAGAALPGPASAASTVVGGDGMPTPTIAWRPAEAAASRTATAATPGRPPASAVKNLVAALEQQAEAQAEAAASSTSRKPSPSVRARSPTRKPMLPCMLPAQHAERASGAEGSNAAAAASSPSPSVTVSSCSSGSKAAATAAVKLSVALHCEARSAYQNPAAAPRQVQLQASPAAGVCFPVEPFATSCSKPRPPAPANGGATADPCACSDSTHPTDAAAALLTWQLGAAAGAAGLMALACSLLRR